LKETRVVKLQSRWGQIEVVAEERYVFGAPANICGYPVECDLSVAEARPWVAGLWLDGLPLAVFGADGGGTAVHAHSAVVVDEDLYVAVGNRVICVEVAPFRFRWSLEIDAATCFGIYFDARHDALISHGEVAIARFSRHGEMLWRASGADIFTGRFALSRDCIEVTDFNDTVYCFAYATSSPVPAGGG
jgi:hypothetical protein